MSSSVSPAVLSSTALSDVLSGWVAALDVGLVAVSAALATWPLPLRLPALDAPLVAMSQYP
jgi:hypothetical protein